MRMGSILTSGIFWGALLILGGLSLILKSVFNVDIPLVKIVISVMLIYWGVSMLTGKHWIEGRFQSENESTVVFGEREFSEAALRGQNNVIFGKGRLDLRDVDQSALSSLIEFNVIFGAADIILDSSLPVKIVSETIMGSVAVPGGSTTAFGESVYLTPGYSEDEIRLTIRMNVIFGGINIIQSDK